MYWYRVVDIVKGYYSLISSAKTVSDCYDEIASVCDMQDIGCVIWA